MVRFLWHAQFSCCMPSGAVHQNDAMRFTSTLAPDFVKTHLHGFSVSKGQHQGRILAFSRADGTKETGIPVALIGWLARACALSCP